MAIHRAFDGQVVFDVSFFNLKAHVVYKRIYDQRPAEIAVIRKQHEDAVAQFQSDIEALNRELDTTPVAVKSAEALQIAEEIKTLEQEVVVGRVDGRNKANEELAKLFDNFATFLACTNDILFDLKEDADDDLLALRDFWAQAQYATDYAALWEVFLSSANLDINDAWAEAYRKAQPKRLRVERTLGRAERLTDEEKKIPMSSAADENAEKVSARVRG